MRAMHDLDKDLCRMEHVENTIERMDTKQLNVAKGECLPLV